MDMKKILDLYESGMDGVVVSTNGDPLTEMVLDQKVIQEAAKKPKAIACLMVDMAFSEGKSVQEGCALYFEHRDNKRRLLSEWETGSEGFITGGWVRVMTSASVYKREKHIIKSQIAIGRAVDHGSYRGVKLIEFK